MEKVDYMTILITSIVLGVLIVAFCYILVTPNVKSETFIIGNDSKLDPTVKKTLNFIGGDISVLIPGALKKQKRRDVKFQRLLITSGNPWSLNITEYIVVQIFLGISGLILGGVACAVLYKMINPAILALLPIGLAIIGYNYPTIYYKSIADDRIKAFTHELPEAIDYLRIAMGQGSFGLPKAIELTTNYLDEGVMKREFSRITDSLQTGTSLPVALDEFSKRAPTEGIQAFVNSLNNATRLSAPVVELLRARSEASRKELNAAIDKKIASLDVKVLMAFGPTAYLSILIIVLAPTASSLAQLL